MDEVDKSLEAARIFLEERHPEWALEELDRVPKIYFENEEVCFLRAQSLLDLKQYQKSINIIRAGIRKNPESIPLLYLLCNCEAELGNLAGAERAILAALRLQPEEAGLLCRYALLVAQAGDLDKAQRLVGAAFRIAPEDFMVTRAQIAISYLRGDEGALIRNSRDLLEEDPDDVFSHYMLASSLFGQGKITEASQHLQIAAELDSRDSETAEAAHASKMATHWLLWPLRPLYKYDFAFITIWFVAIAAIFMLITSGFKIAAAIFGLVYFLFCLYSWFAPFLVKLITKKTR
jgi:tetratricopeptide (TPR) repeat protein